MLPLPAWWCTAGFWWFSMMAVFIYWQVGDCSTDTQELQRLEFCWHGPQMCNNLSRHLRDEHRTLSQNLADWMGWNHRLCYPVAQHCCNDDQQSQWKNGDFDPSPRRSETPENFITKIGHSALHSVISFVMMLWFWEGFALLMHVNIYTRAIANQFEMNVILQSSMSY